jgi:lysyl-tRNA synthetase class II
MHWLLWMGNHGLLTSKYHSLTGREWVKASQLRCTSKSVDLLPETVSMPDDAHSKQRLLDILCGEEKDLQCRGHDGALGD